MKTQELINKLRDLGLSQVDIGMRTKIPQPTISRWAAGKGTGSPDNALALRDLYDNVVKRK